MHKKNNGFIASELMDPFILALENYFKTERGRVREEEGRRRKRGIGRESEREGTTLKLKGL